MTHETQGAGAPPVPPHSGPPSGVARRGRLRRAFAKDARGVIAVEYAMLAFPLFGLLFAALQVALVFWSTEILETAVAAASRQLYTGQFQTSSANAGLTATELQAKFKTLVCSNVVGVFDCPATVSVDVRTFSGFATATAPAPVTNGVYDTSSYGYAAPNRNDIVVVRASMQMPNYASLLTPGATLRNGYQLIVASAAFRTEPY